MIVYATDEDVALRASTDFSAICPRDQVLASGSDGVFISLDPWTLRSSSVDFAAFGLVPGQLARLTKPTTAFGPNGELFAIQAVGGGTITLRRKGQAAGVGQPPASQAGLTNVEFAVRTLGPQIQLASYDLDRRFGIDDAVAGRSSSDLHDPHQLREAVVLTVLYNQYLDQSRQFAGRIADQSETPGDVYAAKARIARVDLDELLDRLALKWNQADVASRAIATTGSARASRDDMAISYNIYANDGRGGFVNYQTPIATTQDLTHLVGPLVAPSDNTFAVRAFDSVSGIEEANTDVRVRIIIDASGNDVTARPNAVIGLAVRSMAGGTCWVSWGYDSTGQGGPPVVFRVSLTAGASPSLEEPTATVACLPGVVGYGCTISGLASNTLYTIAVQAIGSSDVLVADASTISIHYRVNPLSDVDSLIAIPTA